MTTLTEAAQEVRDMATERATYEITIVSSLDGSDDVRQFATVEVTAHPEWMTAETVAMIERDMADQMLKVAKTKKRSDEK